MPQPACDDQESRRHWYCSPDLWAPLLLVLLGILFFADFLFTSKNFYFRDILNFHYPLRRVVIDAYARWEWPLWNPRVYLGQPMLANPNYMALYPTNLLHLLFPFDYAFKLHFIVHVLLAGPGLYALQRRLGILPAAALFGGLTYQFSGAALSFLNLFNLVPVIALLPWIGWAFLRALEIGSVARCAGFGFLVGLHLISSEPLTCMSSALLMCGLAIHKVLQSNARRQMIKAILRLGFIGGLFALGFIAVQILPTLELLPLSVRGDGYSLARAGGWSLHPIDLLNAIIPNLYGDPYVMGYSHAWGESLHGGREPYLVSCFLGTVAFFLATLSVFSVQRKLASILAGMTLIALVFALGGYNPLFPFLYEYLPFFRLGRFPSKFFLLVTLLLSMLSALGSEVVLSLDGESAHKRRAVRRVAILVLLCSIAVIGYMLYEPKSSNSLRDWIQQEIGPERQNGKDIALLVAQLQHSILRSGIFLLIGSLLALFLFIIRKAWLRSALLVLASAAELLSSNLRLAPLISGVDVEYIPEVNRYIQQNGPREPFRVYPPSQNSWQSLSNFRVFAPNNSTAWMTLFARRSGQPFYGIVNGIQYSLFSSVDHLNTLDSDTLYQAQSALPIAQILTLSSKVNSPLVLSVQEIKDPRLQLLSAFDTRSTASLHAYWIKDAMSRVFFASSAVHAKTHQAALQTFLDPSFPFDQTVILEEAAGEMFQADGGRGKAKIIAYQNQRVLCEVQAESAGYLVLLDSYYPGWKAWVDGKEEKILRADFAFRAIAVPAGIHRVEFRYRPVSFYVGLTISVVTFFVGAATVLRRRFGNYTTI